MSFFTAFRKEWLEQRRSKKLLIALIVLTLFGMTSPFLRQMRTFLCLPNICRLSCTKSRQRPDKHLHVIAAPAPKREVDVNRMCFHLTSDGDNPATAG